MGFEFSLNTYFLPDFHVVGVSAFSEDIIFAITGGYDI